MVYVLMIEANSMCIEVYIQKNHQRVKKKGTSNFHEVQCFTKDENQPFIFFTRKELLFIIKTRKRSSHKLRR